MILIAFGFLAGLVTVASPCILPLLPIVLSGSVGEGKRRPLGVIAGFILSFTVFTLSFSLLVQATGVSPNILRWFAVGLLSLLGLVMLIPKLQVAVEAALSQVANAGQKFQGSGTKQTGFSGGLLVGLSLGMVWTPCVGPIMAAVITLAASGGVTAVSVAVTVAFSLGTAIPMLGIVLGGRALMTKLTWLKRNGARVQRVFAVLMIVTALGIGLNVDRSIQSALLDQFPGWAEGLSAFEENAAVKDKLETFEMDARTE